MRNLTLEHIHVFDSGSHVQAINWLNWGILKAKPLGVLYFKDKPCGGMNDMDLW